MARETVNIPIGPIFTGGSCRGIVHVIQRGDTLYNLGKQYHVSVTQLMFANPFVNVYNLQIGDELCIPTRIQPREEETERMGRNMGDGTQNRMGDANMRGGTQDRMGDANMRDNMGDRNQMGEDMRNRSRDGMMRDEDRMGEDMRNRSGDGMMRDNMGDRNRMDGTMRDNMGDRTQMDGTMRDNMGDRTQMDGTMRDNMGDRTRMGEDMRSRTGDGMMRDNMGDQTGERMGRNMRDGMRGTEE